MAGPLTKTGRYQIVSELGRGSMGVVYQGYDPLIGRTVAIKTMLIEGLPPSEFEEYKARFQREAQSAGVLTHPNIVTVYDFGEDDGVLFLAMEFLVGKSIQQLVDKQNVLPIETILPMYEQICGALDHAHQHKIVHRDIKPANIMILESGLIKVTDFGIAKIMSMGMTQAGQILGTPNYMSPEQVKGRQVDGRSDIFSLGVILYELVTGEKPFGGQNITTVIYKIINENPISPRELDATIHPGLSYVISKALAKSADERYQTCRELAEDLRNYKSLGTLNPPSATVVMRVPTMHAHQAETPPPRAEKRAESPAPEPQRLQTPPPAPAPREQQMPAVPAPVFAAAKAQQKSSSPALWIVLALVLIAGLGGVGYYLIQQQNKKNVVTQDNPSPLTKPETPAGGPPASTTVANNTTPSSGTAATPSSTPPTVPPAASVVTPAPTVVNPAPSAATSTTSSNNGKLIITSNPKGAIISVDGTSYGRTPSRPQEFSAGDHNISISKEGYEPNTQKVTVLGGRTTSTKIILAKAAQDREKPKPAATSTPASTPATPPPATVAGEGTIIIDTSPSGLPVSVDGTSVGVSQAHATVSAGKDHTYSVTCPDADPTVKTFNIGAGVIKSVKVTCKTE